MTNNKKKQKLKEFIELLKSDKKKLNEFIKRVDNNTSLWYNIIIKNNDK